MWSGCQLQDFTRQSEIKYAVLKAWQMLFIETSAMPFVYSISPPRYDPDMPVSPDSRVRRPPAVLLQT